MQQSYKASEQQVYNVRKLRSESAAEQHKNEVAKLQNNRSY
jgi:hypothetical protein